MGSRRSQQTVLTPSAFYTRVLRWFAKSGRHDLPWQQDINPYRVWVSEIMLQQTQVKTVIGYFNRFMQRFPTIEALASAPIDDVLHLWTGLGYYARARNLHRAAVCIKTDYDGIFPTAFADIIKLPGIGRSTAGAISSLALQTPQPILDGNVKRVLARTHAITGWPGEKATQETLWALAARYTPSKPTKAADYTQAIMDLGATVCKRTAPACAHCPLQAVCLGKETPTAFPGRRLKKALPIKQTQMAIVLNAKNEVLLIQRPAKGIWGGLWCFPQCDDKTDLIDWYQHSFNGKPAAMTTFARFRHTFSHYHLAIEATLIRLDKANVSIDLGNQAHIWYNMTMPAAIGLPAPVKTLLIKLENTLGACA